MSEAQPTNRFAASIDEGTHMHNAAQRHSRVVAICTPSCLPDAFLNSWNRVSPLITRDFTDHPAYL